MRAVWSDQVLGRFVVRDVQPRMPELAYTTVMTTLTRLARKGLLKSEWSLVNGHTDTRLRLRRTSSSCWPRGSRWTGRRALRRFGAGRLRSPARGAQPRSAAGAQEAGGKATMSVRRLALTAASIPALCGVGLGSCSQLMGACLPLEQGLAMLLPVPSA